jgi:hypothetical protein
MFVMGIGYRYSVGSETKMILVWNDLASFNRHLENIRWFHRRHRPNGKPGWGLIKDMPLMREMHIPAHRGGARWPFEASRRVVPQREIALPAYCQN